MRDGTRVKIEIPRLSPKIELPIIVGLGLRPKMQDLPFEIVEEVLRRLPADSLWQLRNVCKAWRRIIDYPSFVRSHSINQHSNCSSLLIRERKGASLYSLSLETLNQVKEGPQTIEVAPIKQFICEGARCFDSSAAVCNGLILIYDFDSESNRGIWNPLTRDFHKLPEPDTEFLNKSGYSYKYWVSSWSLGYDHATDDYKVVIIDRMKRDTEIVFKTRVYSLKLGYWRSSKDFPWHIYCPRKGVFFNGALYWRSPWNEIIMFDLGTEDYTQVQGPPLPTGHSYVHLDVMDGPPLPTRHSYGHLVGMGGCLVFSCYDNHLSSLEGWIMRDLGGEKSWMKLFSIRSEINRLQPVAYLKSKTLLVLHNQSDKKLFLLDIESDTLRKVTIKHIPGAFSVQFSPGSLFRLGNDSGAAAPAGLLWTKAPKRLAIQVRKIYRHTGHQSFSIIF